MAAVAHPPGLYDPQICVALLNRSTRDSLSALVEVSRFPEVNPDSPSLCSVGMCPMKVPAEVCEFEKHCLHE